MKFTNDTSKLNIDFSELINEREIWVCAYETNSSLIKVQLTFSEKEMRELRKHLTIQIRKIKKA